MATHTKARPVAAYMPTAVKTKLKRADPANRTRFREAPAKSDPEDPRNSNPTLARLVTCQTMTQFAEKLQSIAGIYS